MLANDLVCVSGKENDAYGKSRYTSLSGHLMDEKLSRFLFLVLKDVIAMRKNTGTVAGEVRINGFPQVGAIEQCAVCVSVECLRLRFFSMVTPYERRRRFRSGGLRRPETV